MASGSEVRRAERRLDQVWLLQRPVVVAPVQDTGGAGCPGGVAK